MAVYRQIATGADTVRTLRLTELPNRAQRPCQAETATLQVRGRQWGPFIVQIQDRPRNFYQPTMQVARGLTAAGLHVFSNV